MADLQGKVAIITGAAQGQGAAEARLFCERGAKVVLTDLLLDAAVAIADEIGSNAVAVRHDVSREESWRAVVQAALDTFGHVDVLVNNAGIYRHGPLLDLEAADYEQLIAVNQVGVYHGMRATAPAMIRERRGRSSTSCPSPRSRPSTTPRHTRRPRRRWLP